MRCWARTIMAAALCSPSIGCLVPYSTRPVEIQVTRTDTGEPAAGVPVKVSYASMLVLNQPTDVQGTTDSTGRVTLPMADFRSGPCLQAGTTNYWAPSELIRDGGSLNYKPSANPDEPVPIHTVLLIPRPRSLAERFLGWQDARPTEGSTSQ
jgi:hypothetical protein